MLNTQDKQMLDAILAMDPNAISDDQRAVLRARRSYLTEEQTIKFGIKESKPAKETADEASTADEQPVAPEKPAKRSRKAADEQPVV